MRTVVIRSLVAAMMTALGLGLLAGPATALASQSETRVLDGSDPEHQSKVAALPETVSVTMADEITGEASLQVLDDTDGRVDNGEVTVAGRRVLVGAKDTDVRPGTYRLAFDVETTSGRHEGEVTFTVTGQAGVTGSKPSGDGGNAVQITEIEENNEAKWAPLWILGFLLVTSALIVYIIKAGLTSADDE